MKRVKVKSLTPIVYQRIGKPKIKSYDDLARQWLTDAGRIFDQSGNLDTAVRDSVSTGLAYLVEAAYDAQACSLGLEDDAFFAFISASTAEWFRSRDFAEWFCLGASVLFRTSRPRLRSEIKIVRVKRYKSRRARSSTAPKKTRRSKQ